MCIFIVYLFKWSWPWKPHGFLKDDRCSSSLYYTGWLRTGFPKWMVDPRRLTATRIAATGQYGHARKRGFLWKLRGILAVIQLAYRAVGSAPCHRVRRCHECNICTYVRACVRIYLPTHLPTYLSVCLSVCLSIDLSIYLERQSWCKFPGTCVKPVTLCKTALLHATFTSTMWLLGFG